jgi:hypothetical protein
VSIRWLTGKHAEIISVTNCACSTSISALILAWSASYAFLSGFPPVNVSNESDASFELTGVAVPLVEAATSFAFPFGGALAGMVVDWYSDTWKSDYFSKN